jgi:hypothetical protein
MTVETMRELLPEKKRVALFLPNVKWPFLLILGQSSAVMTFTCQAPHCCVTPRLRFLTHGVEQSNEHKFLTVLIGKWRVIGRP